MDSNPLFGVRWPTGCCHVGDGVRLPWIVNDPNDGDADGMRCPSHTTAKLKPVPVVPGTPSQAWVDSP